MHEKIDVSNIPKEKEFIISEILIKTNKSPYIIITRYIL